MSSYLASNTSNTQCEGPFPGIINNCSSFGGICILPFCISKDEYEFHLDYRWWIEGVGSASIGVLGLLFNMTTIIVVLGSDLAANFFNWLLVFLALFDNLFLINRILESFRNHVINSEIHKYAFVSFLYYAVYKLSRCIQA